MNKSVLITGGAKRLGAAMAKAFHTQGYHVFVHYNHSYDDATALQQELNTIRHDSCDILKADLSDIQQVTFLAVSIKGKTDQLDVLVNNASQFFPTPLGDAQAEQWDQLINPNVKAPYFLTQALISHLEKAHGCVINMHDIHAQRPLDEHSIYCLSKAALTMLTQSQAKELAPNIRVNGIAPGAIIWPEQATHSYEKSILEKIPLNRCGNVEDIINTALFLTQSTYITGQTINVDGGRSLHQ
jgi:pteridine reductase